jgi:hypothetical protein
MHFYRALVVITLAVCLVGCGEGPQGEKGDPGPGGPPGENGAVGPAGPSGPPGISSAVRILRTNCDATNCTAQCSDDEVLLIAYCGPMRNPAMARVFAAGVPQKAAPFRFGRIGAALGHTRTPHSVSWWMPGISRRTGYGDWPRDRACLPSARALRRTACVRRAGQPSL